MAEFKGVKRSAERAAREALGTTMIDAAGQLGVALAIDQAQRERVRATLRRSEELIDAARSEGAALVESAEAEAAQSASSYRRQWNESKTAGWRPAQLVAMGYPRPSATAERGSRPAVIPTSGAAHAHEDGADGQPTVPADHSDAGPVDRDLTNLSA